MFKWIIEFFKKLFGFVTLDPTIAVDTTTSPPLVIVTVIDDEPVVSDEEALETLESTIVDVELADLPPTELPDGFRLVDGVVHFWSGLTGWTPVPDKIPESHGEDFKALYQGPPFAWNLAGQIGQPRYKPDDWTEKGPDYDRDAYRAKHPVA